VIWGTRLRHCVIRSRVRLLMVSLEFFIDIILPVALWPWSDWTSKRNYYQECFLGGKGGRCKGADNLNTFMHRLSGNLAAWTSWDPQGLSRSAQGLIYVYVHTSDVLLMLQRSAAACSGVSILLITCFETKLT